MISRLYVGTGDNRKGAEWKPEFGVGGVFPPGSEWALMMDGVTSHLEVTKGHIIDTLTIDTEHLKRDLSDLLLELHDLETCLVAPTDLLVPTS